jgi:hypothetical protein
MHAKAFLLHVGLWPDLPVHFHVCKEHKKKGKVHGKVHVKVVDLDTGVKQLDLSWWDNSKATVLKRGGYLDFICRCNF